MNRLDLTALGGEPHTCDDITYLQDSIIDAFASLVAEMGTVSGVVILNGCTATLVGSTFTWTAGWVAFANEIWKVDNGSITLAVGQQPLWTAIFVNDPAGAVNYENGSSQNIYKTRKMTLTPGTFGVVYDYNNQNLRNVLGELVLNNANPWRYIGTSGQPAFGSNWANQAGFPPQSALRFRTTKNRYLEVEGVVQGTSAVANVVLFTLLNSVEWPVTNHRILIHDTVSGGVHYLLIKSNGNVEFEGYNAFTPSNVKFYIHARIPLD